MPSGRNIWTVDDWAPGEDIPVMRVKQTKETLNVMAPVTWKDDFLGYQLLTSETGSTGLWDVTASNSSTVALVSTQPHGVAALTLTSDSEAQQANLDFGDVVPFDPNKGLVAEFRINMAVTPTDVAEIFFGLTDDNDVASESKDIHASFRFDGSADLYVSHDDGSTDSAVDTGFDGADGTWYVCRIDMTDLEEVTFHVNGTLVATADMSNVSQTDYLQPYITAYKA